MDELLALLRDNPAYIEELLNGKTYVGEIIGEPFLITFLRDPFYDLHIRSLTRNSNGSSHPDPHVGNSAAIVFAPSSTQFSTSSARAVPGATCQAIFHLGKQCSITSGNFVARACGSTSGGGCETLNVGGRAATHIPARRSWMPSR